MNTFPGGDHKEKALKAAQKRSKNVDHHSDDEFQGS